ncbi:MAG TPA: hypothetical protein VIF62_38810, partial [Labilithrix sp.]
PDKNGSAVLDLKPLAAKIRGRLVNLRTPVKIVCLSTERNFPDSKKAVIDSYVLIRGEPKITLTPEDKQVVVGQFVNVKVQAQDLDVVKVTIEQPSRFAGVNKPQIGAKTDNIVVTGLANGAFNFVAIGFVGGVCKVVEKVAMTAVGPSVKLDGIGYEDPPTDDAQPIIATAPPPDKAPLVTVAPAQSKRLGQVTAHVEGPAGANYTLVFTPKGGGAPIEVSGAGPLPASGSFDQNVTLDARFDGGDYDVTVKFASGATSPAAPLTITGKKPSIAVDPAAADPGSNVNLTLTGPTSEDYTLIFTPDADTAKAGQAVVQKTSPVGKLDQSGDAKGALAIDGATFKAGSYGVVLKTQAGETSPSASLKVNKVVGILVAGDNSNQVHRVNPTTGVAAVVASAKSNVAGIVVDQQKRVFFTSTQERTLLQLNADGTTRLVATLPFNAETLANDPDTNDLFVTTHDVNTNAGGIYRVNPDSGTQEQFATFGSPLRAIAVAQGSVYTVPNGMPGQGGDPTLYAFDIKTKKKQAVATMPNDYDHGIFFDADGSNAYVGIGNAICRVNLTSCKIDRQYAGFTAPAGALFMQDGTLVIVDEKTNKLSKLDLASGAITPIGTDGVGENPYQIAFDDQPYPTYKSQWKPPLPDAFITDLGTQSVYALNAKAGTARAVVQGLGRLSGISIDTT